MIEVANYIRCEDINANLHGIHSIYNTETMSPSWKVDSLLCATYFSVFYLKPRLELYRPCDNPRCSKYFLVKTTSTRNRYCSTECCNRVSQERYRKKRRELSENNPATFHNESSEICFSFLYLNPCYIVIKVQLPSLSTATHLDRLRAPV